MLTKIIATMVLVAAFLALLASAAAASVPFPPLSTCTVTITQYQTRTACRSNFEPDVVRLTPAGSTATPPSDRVSITVRVRDPFNLPVPGALLVFSERSGVVNIANGGASTALTDIEGLATAILHGGSGYGIVALCADGVPLCSLQVRSPDVNRGPSSSHCTFGTGMSVVGGSDITNPLCGFLTNFGPVTPGVNDGWDLDCSGSVAGGDIVADPGKGGMIFYFGDAGTLGSQNSCEP